MIFMVWIYNIFIFMSLEKIKEEYDIYGLNIYYIYIYEFGIFLYIGDIYFIVLIIIKYIIY